MNMIRIFSWSFVLDLLVLFHCLPLSCLFVPQAMDSCFPNWSNSFCFFSFLLWASYCIHCCMLLILDKRMFSWPIEEIYYKGYRYYIWASASICVVTCWHQSKISLRITSGTLCSTSVVDVEIVFLQFRKHQQPLQPYTFDRSILSPTTGTHRQITVNTSNPRYCSWLDQESQHTLCTFFSLVEPLKAA